MKTSRRLSGFKKVAVISTTGTAFAFPLGACDLGEFTTTTTTTLNARDMVVFLIRGAILTPIDNLISNAVDAFFDQFEEEDN